MTTIPSLDALDPLTIELAILNDTQERAEQKTLLWRDVIVDVSIDDPACDQLRLVLAASDMSLSPAYRAALLTSMGVPAKSAAEREDLWHHAHNLLAFHVANSGEIYDIDDFPGVVLGVFADLTAGRRSRKQDTPSTKAKDKTRPKTAKAQAKDKTKEDTRDV